METLALTRPDLLGPRNRPGQSSQASAPADDADDDDADEKAANVDFGPYMAKMKRDIQSKWKPPKGFTQRSIAAVFSIMRDGQIVDPRIVDSSGIEDVDNSALEALKVASPLDPLPQGAPKSVQIRYQFDWKVSAQ